MTSDGPLAVFSRRKWSILAIALVFAVVAGGVSKTLTKVYATDSTLFVTLSENQTTFDTVQASQAIARSYADIIRNPNIAQQVANKLKMKRSKVLDETTFSVTPETQLLKVHAEDPSPGTAKSLADTYAQTFIDYARANLESSTKATVTQAVAAPLPSAPVRPKPTLYTLVALILGLVLGTALAFARDKLDTRLRTAEDVEARLDESVLVRIPRRGRSETARSAFKEAFRILRTNLQFARGRSGFVGSVAITSWGAGEGKTTTAAQLAIAAAETGGHVIVVEADFRRPAMQRELFSEETAPLWPGLSNYLAEAASLEEVLYPSSLPNITLLPAGPLPPSPAALLDSPRGRKLVDDLDERADFVIFDCAPLSVGAEAAVIASWSDGVLLMVDLASSSQQSIREAARRLETVNAHLLGLVVNRDRMLEPSAYDYYHPGSDRAERPRAQAPS